MHEFSIAESLVRAIDGELERQDREGVRLLKARVVVGRMRQIVPENLCMAFDILTRETRMAGAELELVTMPVVARCEKCGREAEIEMPFFACGKCGSGDLDITGGRELYLDLLEVNDEECHEDQGV